MGERQTWKPKGKQRTPAEIPDTRCPWSALGRQQWKWVFCVGGSRPSGGVDVRDGVKDNFQVADCNN